MRCKCLFALLFLVVVFMTTCSQAENRVQPKEEIPVVDDIQSIMTLGEESSKTNGLELSSRSEENWIIEWFGENNNNYVKYCLSGKTENSAIIEVQIKFDDGSLEKVGCNWMYNGKTEEQYETNDPESAGLGIYYDSDLEAYSLTYYCTLVSDCNQYQYQIYFEYLDYSINRWDLFSYCTNTQTHFESGVPDNDDYSGPLLYQLFGSEGEQYVGIIGFSEDASGEITVPETINDYPVKEIMSSAFCSTENDAITRVILPENLETIHENAFSNCQFLRSVKFGSKLHTIKENAFLNCYRLSSIEYSGSINDWNSIDIDYGNEVLSKRSIEKFQYGALSKNELWSFSNPYFTNWYSPYITVFAEMESPLSSRTQSWGYIGVATNHCLGMAISVALNHYDHRFTDGYLSEEVISSEDEPLTNLNDPVKEFIMNAQFSNYTMAFKLRVFLGSLNVLQDLHNAGLRANEGRAPSVVAYRNHAVLCYGQEYGNYRWKGKTYPSRALIYDCNNGNDFNAAFCVYYDLDTGEYIVPVYSDISAVALADDRRVCDNWGLEGIGGREIRFVTSDLSILDPVNTNQTIEQEINIVRILGLKNKEEAEAIINTIRKMNSKELNVLYNAGETFGGSNYSDIYIALPDDCENLSIPLTSVSSPITLILERDHRTEYVRLNVADSVNLYADGRIQIYGNESDYEAGLDDSSSGYVAYCVNGTTQGDIELSLNNKNLSIIGENLVGTEISGYSDMKTETNTITIENDAKNIAISQHDDQIMIIELPEFCTSGSGAQNDPWIIPGPSAPTNMSTGWYQVTGNVEASERIVVSGDVHIMIEKTVTVPKGIQVLEENSLTISGGKEETGKLIISEPDENFAGIGGSNTEACGTVRIMGGSLKITAGSGAQAIGGAEASGTLFFGDVTVRSDENQDSFTAFTLREKVCRGSQVFIEPCGTHTYDSDPGLIMMQCHWCGAIGDENGKGDFILPADLTIIADNAFDNLAIKSVYIPDGCTSIGAKAFAGCKNLIQIRLPNSVKPEAIAVDAFPSSSNLVFIGPAGGTAAQIAADPDHPGWKFSEEKE